MDLAQIGATPRAAAADLTLTDLDRQGGTRIIGSGRTEAGMSITCHR
ncbi:hypothetical protein LNQ03_08515 [Klebsiella pneumoniae subsp. pneumoniae]|nr:hypothetical protein [Klebsiella pneumoniae subsp. pneumoniae]